ncbi:MAG: DUF3786 domain-containing protein [Actinomycetota bacterium]
MTQFSKYGNLFENLEKNKKVIIGTYNNYFGEISKRDLKEIAENTGSDFIDKNKLEVLFYNNLYELNIEKKKILDKENYKPVDPYTSSIILHYLLRGDGTQAKHNWISYRELPHGLIYSQTIPKAIQPVILEFGRDGNAFIEKAKKIGGKADPSFEWGTVIYPFVRVPILFILYPQSEEFSAGAKILFDANIPHYLETDVVKLVVIYTVKKLIS